MNRQSWCQEESSQYAILPSRSPYQGLLLQVPWLQERGRRLLDRMFHKKSALVSPSLPPWPGDSPGARAPGRQEGGERNRTSQAENLG
jgi:hypothetical protein